MTQYDIESVSGQAVAIGPEAQAVIHYYGDIIIRPDTLEDLPPAPGPPPFKGLAYFTEEDKDIFFGREALTSKITGRLQQTRFLAIVGASGSGKSSLLRAGVVPALRAQNWLVHIITPGAKPLAALANSLTRDDLTADTEALQSLLAEKPEILPTVAGKLAGRANGSQLLLLVDQFEELFTLCKEEPARQAFLNTLLAAAQAEGPATIAVSVRADFYDHCLRYPELRDLLAEHQEPIGQMTQQELVRVIAEPAKRGGWQFVEGLVEQILEDVGQEPGRLPLLSHALRETWERRRGTVMTLAGYRAAGGVEGAIAHTADETMQQLADTTPEMAGIAKTIFLALTELGEGAEDTRRPATYVELLAETGRAEESAGQLDTVLETLVVARLITRDEHQVQVAHEALIRRWPRLKDWLADNREALRFRRQLAQDAQEWDELARDPGALYRGARLAQATEWANHTDNIPPLVSAFLAASQAEAQEEAQRQTQLARATLVRRVAITVGVLAILFLIAAITAGAFATSASRARATSDANALAAATAQQEAQAETTRAVGAEATSTRNQATAVAAQATSAFNEQLALAAQVEVASLNRRLRAAELAAESKIAGEISLPAAILLASEAISQTTRAGEIREAIAEESLRQALAVYTGRPLVGHESAVVTVAFSPDGRWLATGSYDGTTRLWDGQNPEAEPLVLGRPELWVNALAFTPDGRWLATGGLDGAARVWDLQAPDEEPFVLDGHQDSINALAFSPNGRWLATASDDNTARLWDWQDPEADPQVLRGHLEAINTVAFSPDGRWLATGSRDRRIRLWDWQDPDSESLVLSGHTDGVNALTFSPDGRWLASGGDDDTIRLWEWQDPESAPLVLRSNEGAVLGLAFSPDSRILASGTAGRMARLWDMENLESEPQVYRGHEGAVFALAFSPDGRWLATGSSDSTARLWDRQALDAEPVVLAGHANWIDALAFSPDDRWLATSSGDQTVLLWDRQNADAQPLILRDHVDGVNTLAFSPDGRWLATGSNDNTTRLWDLQAPESAPLVLSGHESAVETLAFSSNGRWLATGSDDGESRLWDMQSLDAAPVVLRGHEDRVYVLAFSPDSRWLATGSFDNTARLWDLQAADNEPLILSGHEGEVYAEAFSPDGRWLATGSHDGTGRLWDLQAPESEPFILRGQLGVVDTLAFSPDGRWLAIGGADETIRLWDVQSLESGPLVLQGHKGSVEIVAFSFDGRRLATGSNDGTIRLWDMQAPESQPVVLSGHEGAIFTLAFSHDDRWLATGGSDNTVRLWRLDPGELFRLACARTGRNFTWEEWETYFPTESYRRSCPAFPIDTSFIDILAEEGQIEKLLDDLQVVLTIDPDVEIHSWEWNSICWFGSLWGYAAEVLEACDQAVALATEDEIPNFRDSRGLARALTGDYAGAIEDFRFFVEQRRAEEGYERIIEERESWIAALEDNENPFDEATLDALKDIFQFFID